MSDQTETTVATAMPEAEVWPDRYFWLSYDRVLARLERGWKPQVWQPRLQRWADYPDLRWDLEGREISEAEAQKHMADQDFGEVAPELAARGRSCSGGRATIARQSGAHTGGSVRSPSGRNPSGYG